MSRFTSFTKKISRQQISLIIALLMLFAPAFITATVESAQRKNAKATPTPKKKATPTPNKKTQAKTKPTPKKTPTPANKSKTKSQPQTASKNKTTNKKTEKTTPKTAKTNKKTDDKNKSSKTSNTKNTKQSLAKNLKTTPKNTKNSKTTTVSKNTPTKNKPTTVKSTNVKSKSTNVKSKPTTAKTTKTPKTTPKSTVETKPKTTTETVIKMPDTTKTELPQIIVTTLSVPVRSQANANAVALSNVKLGTILKVTEKNPAWYKVQFTENGKTSDGWISANSVNDLNAADKEEIYRQIVERNYKTQMDFASASELYEFLTNVNGELVASDSSAEIELKRLLALRSALKNIPVDKKDSSPYKEFLSAQEKEIVYNEPAGEWLVVSNQFWDLQKKYRKSSVSETIAWEAANNPLPGECEGYVNCYLFDMRMRFGEYLNLHPNGKNAAEALKNITDYLAPMVADSNQKKIYNGPTDVTDRAEFNNLLAELRTIISRLPLVEKEKTLQQLKQIAEAYR